MEEEFKSVKGYEGLYEVSNLGRVKSLSRTMRSKGDSVRRVEERILKGTLDSAGYYSVNLSKNGTAKVRKIHQLVTIAFLGHAPSGHEIVVDHINNDKTNNRLDNLQLVTPRENCSKDREGTSKYVGVSWKKSLGKWISQIYINGKKVHLGVFDCEIAASNVYQEYLVKFT